MKAFMILLPTMAAALTLRGSNFAPKHLAFPDHRDHRHVTGYPNSFDPPEVAVTSKTNPLVRPVPEVASAPSSALSPSKRAGMKLPTASSVLSTAVPLATAAKPSQSPPDLLSKPRVVKIQDIGADHSTTAVYPPEKPSTPPRALSGIASGGKPPVEASSDSSPTKSRFETPTTHLKIGKYRGNVMVPNNKMMPHNEHSRHRALAGDASDKSGSGGLMLLLVFLFMLGAILFYWCCTPDMIRCCCFPEPPSRHRRPTRPSVDGLQDFDARNISLIRNDRHIPSTVELGGGNKFVPFITEEGSFESNIIRNI